MLDLLTAAPREVRFGPRTLRVGPLKLRELGYLQRWIRDHSVRPTVALKAALEFYPEEEHRERKKAAVQADHDWPYPIGSREGNAVLLGDLDGQVYFLTVLLRKYQPELTGAEIDEIAGGLSEDDFGLLVAIAFGEDDFDPEALRAAARQRMRAAVAAILGAAAAGEPTGDGSSATAGASPPTATPTTWPS